MFKSYTMNQVVLPLDLEITLQEDDIAYAVMSWKVFRFYLFLASYVPTPLNNHL
ncbi:hypothetical protein ACFQ1Y_10250 [Virgibacillus alimentarius]